MSKVPTKIFYEQYPKYFNDWSREYIKKIGECQFGDNTCKGILTISHLDQNPANMEIENLKVLCRSHHIRHDQPFHCFNMGKKTDNSHIWEKVSLRLETVELIQKKEINILELYSGDGVIWNKVQLLTDKKINVLKIEKKADKKGIYLKGKNEKFIPSFNFQKYDIVDLDAYGVPFQQLKVLFLKKFKGYVHVTFIQSGMGNLPSALLKENGYTDSMIAKCRTLFTKDGLSKLLYFLAKNKVENITGYFIERKNYFYFTVS